MGGLFHSRSWRQAALILSAIVGFAADKAQHGFSVATIFRKESFNPTLPTERVLLKSYGHGVIEHLHNQAYHIYKDGKNALWIGCRVDEDDRVNRPITAIILSKVRLSTSRLVPGIELSAHELHGLRIGDSVHDVLEKCGQPRRIYNRFLTDELSLLTYEYFPKDKGSCLRFYIESDQVVALGVSSEE
jgi:hypothetical protein